MPLQENTVRSQDVARALAVAWKNIASYPPGHPTLAASLEDAHRKIVDYTALAGSATFGVTREALMIGDEKLEAPHAQKFAEALYRRGVGLFTIDRRIEPWELEMLFRFLAGDPRSAKRALWDEIAAAGLTHVELTATDYSKIRTTTDLDLTEEAQPERHARLAEDILKALLSGRQMSLEGTELRDGEALSSEGLVSLLQRLLEETPEGEETGSGEGAGEGAGAAAGTGQRSSRVAELLVRQVEEHLARPAGAQRQVAVAKIAELMRNLPAEVRRRVLDAAMRILATDPTAEDELRTLARALSPDEVIHALSSLRDQDRRFSNHALKLLEGLMVTGQASARDLSAPDEAPLGDLVGEISTLLGEEDIDRYSPPEHRELIENTNVEVPPLDAGPWERALELGRERLDTLEAENVTRAMREALIEMIPHQTAAVDLEPVFRRIEDQFLETLGMMRMNEAIQLVDRIQSYAKGSASPPHVQAAARKSMERLASGDAVKVLMDWLHLASDDLIPQIQQVIDQFGSVATRNFLYALAEEKDRSRRRKIFDFLAGIGPAIVPDAMALLSDQRWYVVRNMIALLRSVRDKKSLPEIRKLASHPDIRVRLEAIKTLLAADPHVTRELLARALHDPDPKLAETAVVLCGNYGIQEAEEPLLKIVRKRDWFGRHKPLRLKALRALADLGRPSTLERLSPLLRDRWFSFVDADERRTAWELLEHYPAAARAPWIEIGLRSRDATVREIADRLAAQPDASPTGAAPAGDTA